MADRKNPIPELDGGAFRQRDGLSDTLPAEPAAGEASDAEWKARLKAELDRLDGWIEPDVPDAAWFQSLVVKERRELRRKLLRELVFFWLVALAVLAASVAVWFRQPALFFFMQLGAIAVVPVVFIPFRRKRVNKP